MPLDGRCDLPETPSQGSWVKRIGERPERRRTQFPEQCCDPLGALLNLAEIRIDDRLDVVEWLAMAGEAADEAFLLQAAQ